MGKTHFFSELPDEQISAARARILEAALALFHEKGFARTTVRDIASQAGILSGSLFHHFDTKQEILFEVMRLTTKALGCRAVAAVRDIATPEDQLKALVLCELDAIHGEGIHASRVLVDEWRDLEPEYREHILTEREVYEEVWRQVLQGCAASGRLKGRPPIVRQLLHGALAWTRTWFLPGEPLSLVELTDEVCALVLRGEIENLSVKALT